MRTEESAPVTLDEARAVVEQILSTVERWTRRKIRFGGPVLLKTGETRDALDVLAEAVQEWANRRVGQP